MEYATGEQMHALGAAMAAHGIDQAEAVGLWLTATAGQTRPLTADEAAELTARMTEMPYIPTVLRGSPCDAWPYGSWPRRVIRRRHHAD